MQLDMFDKPIAELRVVQVVDNQTGNAISWSLEFRFVSEDRWHPVKVDVYGATLVESNNESGSPATTED